MPIVSAITNSFRLELLEAAHCFAGSVTPTASATSGVTTLTSVSSVVGVAIGMRVSGTNIAANSIITGIGATTLSVSAATTGSISGGTLTISGDNFMCALLKASPTGTYGATTTNYSQVVSASDECTGTGYTAGGVSLSITAPGLGGSTAYLDFANASWGAATLNADGCIIYNASGRLSNTTGRVVAVYSFGSTQSVVGSAFTVVMPSNDATFALVRLT